MSKKCTVEGCNNKHHAKGYCSRHYQQYKRCGCINHVGRSEKDLNEIIEHDDYAEIILYNKQCEEIARTLIDLDDVKKCKQYKWVFKNDSGYVSNINFVGYIHRFIMDCPNDLVVDHINGNKLDNRKSNLRICTQEQNHLNHKNYATNNSGYPGVGWYKKANKWRARIQIQGNEIHLGLFESLDDAIQARQQAEIEYFGDFKRS